MRRISRLVLTGATAVAAVLASAPAALAAPGIDPHALDVPAIKRLRRVGVAVVGAQDRESIVARDFTAKSLVKEGHAVVGLATLATDPSPAWLVGACAKQDLDAVALVRISTDPNAWRVNVDIRDREGKPIVATFSFVINEADVAAQQVTRDQEVPPQPSAPVAADAGVERPHLWVSDKAMMYGPAQLHGAEFYRIVGRPDLAARYERNRSSIKTVRGFGYTAIGIGGTTLVLALAAAAVTPAACALPNTVDALNGKQSSCGNGVGELFLIPAAFGATGAVLLASASAMSLDPMSLPERRALAREYNARVDSSAEEQPPAATRPPRQVQIAVSGAPLSNGDGGIMTLSGRF